MLNLKPPRHTPLYRLKPSDERKQRPFPDVLEMGQIGHKAITPPTGTRRTRST
jgi:hypothetical protein